MLKRLFRKEKKIHLGKNILKKNGITLLFVDERWKKLYDKYAKTQDIINFENEISSLLKEQSRLKLELKQLNAGKKEYMDKIVSLTSQVFDNDSDNAREDMDYCRKEIRRMNLRGAEIERRLEEIPGIIDGDNLEMLECAVNYTYEKMNGYIKRMGELEGLVDEARVKLRKYVEEMQIISDDYSLIYSNMHDLLGSEEIDRLDRLYLLQKNKDETDDSYAGGDI